MCVDAFQVIGVNLPTDWMNVPWVTQSLGVAGSVNYVTLAMTGPSIGTFGQQIRNFQHSKISGRNNTGGTDSVSKGSCN